MIWSKLRFAVVLVSLLAGGALWAQQYVISTVAGGEPPPTPIAAVNASIGQPQGVTTNAAGNVYFGSLNCVFKLDRSGTLTRIAGNSRAGYTGDGGPATNAQLSGPVGVAVDSAGNLYIADQGNNRIRKVSSSGIITTVAGGGNQSPGDGGPATNAQLFSALGVGVDSAGNLYIVDGVNDRIRKVSSNGIITTVAGNGTSGYSGDGGSATGAQLFFPYSVAVDSIGNIYIADDGNNCIRKVSTNGVITTVAGNGTSGYSGDGGPATNAQLAMPSGVAVDSAGNLYLTDSANNRVRRVTPGGIISTVAGNGTNPSPSAGAPIGDGGPATSAQLGFPSGLSVDGAGNLYIGDQVNCRIREVNPSGIITTVAGNGTGSYSGDGGPAAGAQLFTPEGVTLDSFGNLYIADHGNYRVRKVSPGGIISTAAGNGIYGNSGDGGPATSAGLGGAWAVTSDSAGNLYISEFGYVIRKVSPSGIITTVAGNGSRGYSGDGGAATNAQLGLATGVAVDGAGNLYIADTGNNRIRKVSSNGIISTVAGSLNAAGYSGDGGPATNAQLNNPDGVAVDGTGNLYIADLFNNRIRRVSSSGIITTVAGNGTQGYSGDGGLATNAQLASPAAVAVDSAGNLYIADGSYRIRKVSSSGIITTVAGNATQGYSGDGGPAANAQLRTPRGVAVDSAGNVYVADADNNAIRLLQPVGPTLSITSVTNAASNLPGAISPGEIVVLYGSGLGPPQLTGFHVANSGLVDTQLAGTQVFFNGTPAPIIYTWATQVAAIVPYSVSGGAAQVTVTYQGQTSAALSVSITSSAPGIFTLDSTGKGPGAAVNQDGSINTASTPAKIGDIISIYATGEGQTTPAGVDGKPASIPFPQPNLPVTVTIGGQTAQVQYAGGGYGEVAGLLQVNVQIPSGIQTGSAVPVVLKIGNASSQAGVTIAVR